MPFFGREEICQGRPGVGRRSEPLTDSLPSLQSRPRERGPGVSGGLAPLAKYEAAPHARSQARGLPLNFNSLKRVNPTSLVPTDGPTQPSQAILKYPSKTDMRRTFLLTADKSGSPQPVERCDSVSSATHQRVGTLMTPRRLTTENVDIGASRLGGPSLFRGACSGS